MSRPETEMERALREAAERLRKQREAAKRAAEPEPPGGDSTPVPTAFPPGRGR